MNNVKRTPLRGVRDNAPKGRNHHRRYVYLHQDVWDCLLRHAYGFRISPSRLVRDILTAWASTFTPWDDDTFVEGIIKLNYIPLPPEPDGCDNYLAKLGFGEPTNADV